MKLLKITFLIDALITVGFGFYSWLFPKETYGTIIAIPQTNESLFLSVLSSVSVMYVLMGFAALIGFLNKPGMKWIAGLMVVRHLWVGIMKFKDMDQVWVIGDPYPDIIIHSLFTILYLVGIFLSLKTSSQPRRSF